MNFISNFRTIPPCTLLLILWNVGIYIAFNLGLYPHGLQIYEQWALSPYALLKGDWWTLITSMFLHASITHIAFNMLSLYYLGVMCEKVYGKLRYLTIYFLSGIIGGIAYCISNYLAGDIGAGAVGASGAIFGLFGAYGWLLIAQRKFATVFVGPTSKSDLQAYAAMLIMNMAIGFAPGSGIANEAHIGGMITGFIVGMLFYVGLKPVRMTRKAAHGVNNTILNIGSTVINDQSAHQNPQQYSQQRSHQQTTPHASNGDDKQSGQYNPYQRK